MNELNYRLTQARIVLSCTVKNKIPFDIPELNEDIPNLYERLIVLSKDSLKVDVHSSAIACVAAYGIKLCARLYKRKPKELVRPVCILMEKIIVMMQEGLHEDIDPERVRYMEETLRLLADQDIYHTAADYFERDVIKEPVEAIIDVMESYFTKGQLTRSMARRMFEGM